MNTYHILNGDCLSAQLQSTKLNQNHIICRESLVEGDVSADNISEFWTLRAKFINESYQVAPLSYLENTVKELEKMDEIPDHSEVCLWFENDLFCQVNLWFVISILAKNPTLQIYRIFPIVELSADTWKGFGAANSQKLEQAFSSGVRFGLADIQLGIQLWNAYRLNDFSTLASLANTQSVCFEYLPEVCEAHLERFPKENKLGRPQKVIQEIIATKTGDFQSIFSEFSKREGIYGFSDLQIRNIYHHLIANRTGQGD